MRKLIVLCVVGLLFGGCLTPRGSMMQQANVNSGTSTVGNTGMRPISVDAVSILNAVLIVAGIVVLVNFVATMEKKKKKRKK